MNDLMACEKAQKQALLPEALGQLDTSVESICSRIYEMEGLLDMSQPPKNSCRETPLTGSKLDSRIEIINQLRYRIENAIDTAERVLTVLKDL